MCQCFSQTVTFINTSLLNCQLYCCTVKTSKSILHQRSAVQHEHENSALCQVPFSSGQKSHMHPNVCSQKMGLFEISFFGCIMCTQKLASAELTTCSSVFNISLATRNHYINAQDHSFMESVNMHMSD